MSLDIGEGTIPQDEAPETFGAPDVPGWFNAEYPHSTPEHPYGFFPDANGGWDFSRPRKRRPHGKRESTGSVVTSDRADKTARTAAAMLARMNSLAGMSLSMFGLPLAREALMNANDMFEDAAYEALQTDPILARKILSAGASSGKAQLTMAYVMLGGAIGPVAYMEIKAKKETTDEHSDLS